MSVEQDLSNLIKQSGEECSIKVYATRAFDTRGGHNEAGSTSTTHTIKAKISPVSEIEQLESGEFDSSLITAILKQTDVDKVKLNSKVLYNSKWYKIIKIDKINLGTDIGGYRITLTKELT